MSLLEVESMPHECTIRRKVRVKDSIGGMRDDFIEEETCVPCWEQQASVREINDYEKRGISINRKVYFLKDFGLTERHELLITKRMGELVTDEVVLDVIERIDPDASAGLGLLFRVMVNSIPGVSKSR